MKWRAMFAVGRIAQNANLINQRSHEVKSGRRHVNRRTWACLQSLGDRLDLMAMPLSFDGERPSLRRYAPKLGEHNEMIKGAGKKGKS